jgi:hypothetical protein
LRISAELAGVKMVPRDALAKVDLPRDSTFRDKLKAKVKTLRQQAMDASTSHFAGAKSDTSHFADAKSDAPNFAARNRTLRVSRRETGHFAFRGAKPDTPG